MALVTITGETIRDGVGGKDNRAWYAWAAEYQDGDPGVVTPRRSRPLIPSNGELTFEIEAGISAWIENPDGQRYLVTTPVEDDDLWTVIATGVAFPPNTSQARLNTAVGKYVEANREKFRTRAILITEGPDAGLYQWVDELDSPVGDPVPLGGIVTVPDPPIKFSAPVAMVGVTGTDRCYVPRTLTSARMRVASAPAGSDLVVEVQHWDTATWTTIGTLIVGDGSVLEATDTFDVDQTVGDLLRLNVTSVGSSTAATGVTVDVLVTVA